MESIELFKHENFGEIRVFVNEDGNPWFIGVDVAKALGYSRPGGAVVRHCKSGGTLKQRIVNSNGVGSNEFTLINESNLYRLVLRSKLDKAEEFQDWVVEEVLPSIRKTGSYSKVNKGLVVLPQDYEEALEHLLASVKKNKELSVEVSTLKAVNHELKPKAEFYDTVVTSKSKVDINEAAKLINKPGYGRNNLFKFLKSEGILMDNNLPYQKYMNSDYFEVIEVMKDRPGNSPLVFSKTLVTQKGLDFIIKKLSEK